MKNAGSAYRKSQIRERADSVELHSVADKSARAVDKLYIRVFLVENDRGIHTFIGKEVAYPDGFAGFAFLAEHIAPGSSLH